MGEENRTLRNAIRIVNTPAEQIAPTKCERCKQTLSSEFEKMRFDRGFHLGLGDIRLSIGMQDKIIGNLGGSK